MKVLISGGAGFAGSHLARHLAQQGDQVAILDNLSRPGSERNLAWLRGSGADIAFSQVDVREAGAVREIVAAVEPEIVYHLASQVAVTTSVADPYTDFQVNAGGTLNVLEAARRTGAAVVYTSTNKVYGDVGQDEIAVEQTRYSYRGRPYGVSEDQRLDFQSPYACSKGAADQYVLDYARTYDLATIVLRMSCIYGTQQFGNEDQGWVAHFVISAVLGRPLTIYGDGRQVRDLLYIDDLLTVFDRARARLRRGTGVVFNIGGGPSQTISIWSEFGPMLERLTGRNIRVAHGPWRLGDQQIYVSDIRKAEQELGWRPTVTVDQGIRRLFDWVCTNRTLL